MVRNRFDDAAPRRLPATMPLGAAAVAGLFVGLAFGAAAVAVAWTVQSGEVEHEIAAISADPVETLAVEPDPVIETTAGIQALHDRIGTLEGELKVREDKVIALEAEMSRRFDRGAALKGQLDQARAELASTKAELTVAVADRERLTEELRVTVAALDTQRSVTDEVVTTSYNGRWEKFLATARLDVCEKGGRNKTENCRATVLAGMTDAMRGKYLHCLKSGQEEPVLKEAEKNQVDLPEHAMWLDQDERATRDWYVQLCDPTLPEAPGYAVLGRQTGASKPQGI